MGDAAPMLASTGTAVVLVGNVDSALPRDLKSTQLLRHWHCFFAGVDACKPEHAYLAGRDSASFEYLLQLDQLGVKWQPHAADAAVGIMIRFARDILQYAAKVWAFG